MNPIVEYYLLPASPILALFIVGTLLIGLECILPNRMGHLKFFSALLAPVLAIYCTWNLHLSWPLAFSTTGYSGDPLWLTEFTKQYFLDQTVLQFFWAINIFTFFGIVFLYSQFQNKTELGEVLILTVFIAAGMHLLVSANHLLMIFLGLEFLSLPTYVLVGIQRKNKQSCEAALKYFLFGSLATVFLILGTALLYSQFGTMHIPSVLEKVRNLGVLNSKFPLLLGSIALFLVASAFKVGIAPFHMWVPDVYQGASTSITGFMGSAVKLAGFGMILRLFWGMFGPLMPLFSHILCVLAVVTMFVGNIAALAQDDLKRLFAYSSIAHAGYLLLGVASLNPAIPNSEPIYYYLTVYGFMFLGFFALISLVEKNTGSTKVDALSGLGLTHPFLGISFSIFALSAAGIPPTSGFLAKYFLFMEAVKAGNTLYVVLGVISSLIAVYYYLRILVSLYMKEAKDILSFDNRDRLAWFSIAACAFSVLYFSIFPTRLGM